MTPEDAERVVTVARAALVEVGGDPGHVYLHGCWPASRLGDKEAYRALCIGAMAVHGPTYMVRCWPCSPGTARTACTPVRDVLAGHTCGHERITT